MEYLDHYAGPKPPEMLSDTLKRAFGSFKVSGITYPVYRLVWSEHVIEKSGGVWQDWPDHVPIAERGAMSPLLDQYGHPQPMATPIRVVTEVREIPKYSHLDNPGWMVERWMPGSYFGGEEAWYAVVVPGTSVPRLGPYPKDGRYIERNGPFPNVPGTDFLIDCIQGDEKIIADIMAMAPDTYIRYRLNQAEERERKRQEKADEENLYRLKQRMSILTSTTLTAGVLRNRTAERMGITSHMGN